MVSQCRRLPNKCVRVTLNNHRRGVRLTSNNQLCTIFAPENVTLKLSSGAGGRDQQHKCAQVAEGSSAPVTRRELRVRNWYRL